MTLTSCPTTSVLPSPAALTLARKNLVFDLPRSGLGEDETAKRLREEICPALSASSRSPNYYGFVIGGTTPAAKFADHIVTDYDQNVHVHLPNETVATDVEDATLKLLCQLLNLEPSDWGHRIFTTGATGSNFLGLACGRQYIVEQAARRNGLIERDVENLANVARVGLVKSMRFANIEEIQILTTVPHSSLMKAASMAGLGRESIKTVHQVGTGSGAKYHKFDLKKLEALLSIPRTASIVAVSCSEVNTGLFATTGEEMRSLRQLCDAHDAWLHVDGAFGIMSRLLKGAEPQYQAVAEGCANIEFADSITGDGHKMLNVPYDCGFFFSKHPKIGYSVFNNAGAAYLSTGPLDPTAIQAPLHMGAENSRRFRALPVYASLISYGRQGYRSLLERQITLARKIAAFVAAHESYTLLPTGIENSEIYMIVLFRAQDAGLNVELVKRINMTRQIYVSSTTWEEEPACRFAVSNWQVDVERDIKLITEVLDTVWRIRGER